MTRTVWFVALSLLLSFAARAAEAPPAAEKDDAAALESKVQAVTVYADRARVTRVAKAKAPAGAARLAFRKLPGWIDDGSVRVNILPAGAAELVDVQVKRTFLSKPSDEEFQKAERAVREISDLIGTLDDEEKILDAQARQVDSIRAFSMDKLPKDAVLREIKVDTYGEVVNFVTEALRKNAQARRELGMKRRDLQPELAARQSRVEELRARAQLEQREVIVFLQAPAMADLTLQVDYMVPGATWEPVHELRAGLDAQKVTLASLATVTQTTGEDWEGAALTLSTQRPGQTLQVPELKALLVGAGRTLPRDLGRDTDSFALATRNFRAQTSSYNRLNNPATEQAEFTQNWQEVQATQGRVEQVFKAVQQRGTTAHFTATGTQSVRTDGRPVRVPIGKVDLDAEHRLLAAPEISLNVAHVIDLTNTGTQPLLPGKVGLFLEGAFLGTTELDFVSAGEGFALFLGVEDRLKVSRDLDRKRSSLERGSKRTRGLASYVVTAESVSDRSITLQIVDRVPVSESTDVKVTNLRITPECRPDAQGLVRWEVTLAPKEKRELQIEYTVEYPTEWANTIREQYKAGKKSEVILEDQIFEFEKKF